jgi:uncharacterized membrane protein
MITHVPYEPPRWLTRLFERKPAPQVWAPPTQQETMQTSFAFEPALLDFLQTTPTEGIYLPKRAKVSNRRRPRVYTRLQAERDLICRLAFGDTIAAQDDLAKRWNVSKGTVSKWLARWERKRLIPRRQPNGRCKQLLPV